ncbi:MAG: hypothetical protein KGH75_06270 [Rhodospirillales bacterium]|nr:hypothetical protein [Rhodospirillales bacterium]
MAPDDSLRLGRLLAGLCDYYGQTMSEGATMLYVRALSQFPIADIERAAEAHIQDQQRGRFMPKVADFMNVLRISDDEAAAVAWDRVLRQRGGGDDPAACAALESMGGWYPAIGSKNTNEIPFIEKQFALRYSAFRKRAVAENGSAVLAGVVRLPVKS